MPLFDHQRICRLRDKWVELGLSAHMAYPWRNTDQLYPVFLAEFLLKRTTRVVALRVFHRLLARYPTLEDLAGASSDELWSLSKEAGLRHRVEKLIHVAQRLGTIEGIPDREDLLALPLVGPYIADAVLLYSYHQPRLPLDSGIQRVVHRTCYGAHPPRKDPYRDHELRVAVATLLEGLEVLKVRALHQAILDIAWEACRASPLCYRCPVQLLCLYAESTAKAMTSQG